LPHPISDIDAAIRIPPPTSPSLIFEVKFMICLSGYLWCTWRTKQATDFLLAGARQLQGGTNPMTIVDVADYPLGI